MKQLLMTSMGALLFGVTTSFLVKDSGSLDVFNDPLNTDTTALFAGSGQCETCHASNGTANWSASWGDVSQTTLWQASMMANAGRDPYWQAKVTSEVSLFPQHQALIEDICTTCHSPIGRTQAHWNGETSYSLAAMQASAIAKDGVSCTVCHQIQDVNMGSPASYDGNYTITDIRKAFGPFDAMQGGLMQSVVNYQPLWSPHMRSSEMCATCHTLITAAFDSAGNIVGEFVEQAPYIEWKNSVYEDQNVECQGCHMAELDEPIKVTTLPPFIDPRDTVHLHDMVGGNAFMLQILKDNAAAIGATFTNSAMDTTLARTFRMLKHQTVELTFETQQQGDTLAVEVLVRNKTGHKFPTAYPARRAWLHVRVMDATATVVFESGQYNADGIITHEDPSFEPHHDVIRAGNDIQIYELVAADCAGHVTHSLLKSYQAVKDNRLAPLGFLESDATYDTVRIVGDAENDPNFNIENATEGSGTDRITYRLPWQGTGPLTVTVEMVFQSVNPRAADYLFSFNTTEVNAFEAMYMAADKTPIVIASASRIVTSIGNAGMESQGFRLRQNHPNPFNPGTTIEYSLDQPAHVELIIYNALGEKVRTLVSEWQSSGNRSVTWDGRSHRGMDVASGVYLYRLTAGGRSLTRKLILVR